MSDAMRKRSFVIGLCAGIVVKVMCTLAFTLALVGIARLHDPTQEWLQSMRDGRLVPLSTGWITSQCLVLVGAVLSGAACAHWSKPGSWAAPLALALLWLAWSAMKLPEGLSAGWVVLSLSISSLGILLGALMLQLWPLRTTQGTRGCA
jgi:hypothetical protein